MNSFEKVSHWIAGDDYRLSCLNVASRQMNDEWYLSAGFVRNLIWDKLQGNNKNTPLNDIDLIYFDPSNISMQHELQIENVLNHLMPETHWQVKNQAKMSIQHGHKQYKNCIEAMSFWPELETAIGVNISKDGKLKIVSPFKASEIVALSITKNHKCTADVFHKRVSEKGWLKLWPDLKIKI
ncbi:MAG: nucleotidyltransferase family protein [Methylococcales bacterium]|nr:nucleotidyltransferase family protein [Methylococcales bacterium]